MADRRWRIAILSDFPEIVTMLSTTLARMGDEPVAAFGTRGSSGPLGQRSLATDYSSALNLVQLSEKSHLEAVLRASRPDAIVCWAFSWRIAPEVLGIPRFGAVNYHPSMLPRYRGPNPLAWTIRNGDREFGVTWHRIVPEFDAGPILAQEATPVLNADTLGDVIPRLNVMALRMLPRVMEMLSSDVVGQPQSEARASKAPRFADDYASIDWSRSAKSIHTQVRAWSFQLAARPGEGPIAELDGRMWRIRETSLSDPGTGARQVLCPDGPLWIISSESVE